jgi:hypothetical protein
MIGSWFALPHPTRHGSWAWEVVAADGVTVASGVAADETAAGLDCRVALHVAGLEASLDSGSGAVADVALLPSPAGFGGRWAAA